MRRRALAGDHDVARTRPWRELYKVSTNWRTGSARTSTLGRGIRKAVLPEAPRDLSLRLADPAAPSSSSPPPRQGARATAPGGGESDEDADTLLQFYHNLTLSASRTPAVGVVAGADAAAAEVPAVTVHQTLPSGDSTVVGTVASTRLEAYFAARPDFRPPLAVTELRLDEAHTLPGADAEQAGPLLFVAYSTGQFACFRLGLPSPGPGPGPGGAASRPFTAREVYASLALGTPPAYPFAAQVPNPTTPFDPVVLARLHSPLLVTLSRDMTMRFWRIGGGGAGTTRDDDEEEETLQLEEAETPLQARESWAPVVLSLTKESSRRARGGKSDDEEHSGPHFTVSLAYSAPVFPSNWTVGLQEFAVTLPELSPFPAFARTPPKMRITARNATALPAHAALPSTPRRTAPLSGIAGASSPPRAPRNPVTSIEHSHPFIVTSRADNTLDVYEVLDAPLSPLPLPAPPPPSRYQPHPRGLRSAAPAPAPAPGPGTASPPPLRIAHRRTLFGHTARVASVALRPAAAAAVAAAQAGVRCVSAGDDGAVKVWDLTPSRAGSRRGRGREGEGEGGGEGVVVDVRAAPAEAHGDGRGGEAETAWQRMKRRRGAGVRGGRDDGDPAQHGLAAATPAPHKVRRVWVEEDKIVLAERARDGRGEETVRVLRFD